MSRSQAETSEFVPGFQRKLEWPRGESALAQVDAAGLSHVGKVRTRNEDHFFIGRFGRFFEKIQTNVPPGELEDRFSEAGYAMVVADGLGGHAAGDTASKLAINVLLSLVLETSDWILRFEKQSDFERVIERTRQRFIETSRVMTAESQANPELRGFGTTLTLAASVGRDLFVAHVGDTRAYIFRGGKLQQLTTDHTYAQELFEAGVLDDKSAGAAWLKSRVTRLLGDSSKSCEPDIQTLRLEHGDTLLICSDGLCDMVDDTTIVGVVAEGQPAEAACARLVDSALAAGGRDNVTLIIARYSFPNET
ncbi:MAG TPA: protein phosphatase 2C domain-containing protein [Pirellulales bacterium]|jgi:serine/threonine protein phosphatase PrpC|nr:protein phosphatase 2C domain-containing protein [Pirellulales bacterium]